MIIPYHSIHKSLCTITQVFHSPHYVDRAHVKCSLSSSDGNSNQISDQLVIFIPHTNHTHWWSELQVTILHYPGPIHGFDWHSPYARAVSTTEVSKDTKVARRALIVLLNLHQYYVYIGTIPGPDSVQASRSEWLILPAMYGACIQHDKRAINDRSLIDTGRGTTVNTTIRPCPISVSFPHLVTSHHSINS